MKKVWKIILGSAVMGSLLFSGYIVIKEVETKKKQNHQQEVASRYYTYMKTIQDSSILKREQTDWVKVGTLYQNTIVELENIQEDYYQLKGTDYYLFYQDLVAAEEQINPSLPFLLWQEDIVTSSPVTFYQNNIPIGTIDFSIQAPVLRKGEDFYTVLLDNKPYQIPTESIKEHLKSNREEETRLENISILFFSEEENSEEKFAYLKEQQYAFIKESQLDDFLNGRIILPEKTVMLVVKEESNFFTQMIQKYNLTVEYQKDLALSYQKGDSQVKDSSNLYWYEVTANTTLSRFQNMLQGKKEILTNPASKIAVLNYHFFYNPEIEACNESICLPTTHFEEQLQYLKENNFKTLTMQEFNDWLDHKIELPEKSVLLTVDDGAMGTDTHLPNLLAKYDAQATLFLISGWWPMSKYTTGNLEIQSHGHDLHHNDFCLAGSCGVKGLLLSEEELLRDLVLSKETIGDPIAFCYPFYAYNARFVEAVKQQFSLAFIGGNKKADRSVDKYKIPRYVIYKNTSLTSFKKMVNP